MTDLIVNAAIPRQQYLADGVERSYGFPFPLLDANDLLVWLDDQPSPLAYSISGLNQSAGGSILFASPPAAGCRITLARRMAIKRETDFVEGGAFHARALNEELDRLTLLLQQVDEAGSRALQVPPSDAPAALTLPPCGDRAGKLLGFDAHGVPQASLLNPTGITQALQQMAELLAQTETTAAMAQQQVQLFANLALDVEAKLQVLAWQQQALQRQQRAASGQAASQQSANWANLKS